MLNIENTEPWAKNLRKILGQILVYTAHNIGVGRFRILGGPRFRILRGPRGGANSQQAHDVVTTSMRRNDVASTSFWRRVPIRFLFNQCQIITFLILKYDIIENSRIELRGIVLPVQMGGLLGGAKGYVGPPSQIIGGPGPPCPPPPLFLRLWHKNAQRRLNIPNSQIGRRLPISSLVSTIQLALTETLQRGCQK